MTKTYPPWWWNNVKCPHSEDEFDRVVYSISLKQTLIPEELCVVWYRVHGYTFAEISRITSLSVYKIKKLLGEAEKKLKAAHII